jgi:threonine aldolase
MINLASDNVTGVAPEILAAIAAAATGSAPSYGADDSTRRLEARFATIFEREVAVFPVATGTAANALALATLVPPYGAVLCHSEAHIAVDECGAPEFYTGGAKLMPLDGAHGKLDAAAIEAALPPDMPLDVHRVQPRLLGLSQATEAGTVYRPEEVARLAAAARARGLAVHMDGSRFANALAFLGCSPAEATWRAGVDILSFGGTKNGCLAAEAVIVFDPAMACDIAFRRKRGGHLLSKMRFLSAQLDAYLADDLWLRHATHANRQARRLAAGLAALPGVALDHPVEANEIFVYLPPPLAAGLSAAGVLFAPWGGDLARFVTAFDTDPAVIDRVLAIAGGQCQAA